MFILKDKLTFINIDQSYLKCLHDGCAEVYYPKIRVLIRNEEFWSTI